jgi:hypothetical protein
VSWDRSTVVAAQVIKDMTTLRQLGAEHLLGQQPEQGYGEEDVDIEDDTCSITSVVQVHAMLDKVLAKSGVTRESGKKARRRGSGGYPASPPTVPS